MPEHEVDTLHVAAGSAAGRVADRVADAVLDCLLPWVASAKVHFMDRHERIGVSHI